MTAELIPIALDPGHDLFARGMRYSCEVNGTTVFCPTKSATDRAAHRLLDNQQRGWGGNSIAWRPQKPAEGGDD